MGAFSDNREGCIRVGASLVVVVAFVFYTINATVAGPQAPPVGTPVQAMIPAPCSAGDNSMLASTTGGCRVPRAALVTQPAGGLAVDILYWMPGDGIGRPLAALLPCPQAPDTAPCYQTLPNGGRAP